MSEKIIELYLHVGSDVDADDQEIDELALQLFSELNELDSVSAELVQSNELPEGAKGISIDIGAILIKIAEFGGITGLIAIFASWLSRDERRTLKLQIGENCLEVTGLSKTEQENLIHWFKTQSGLRLEL